MNLKHIDILFIASTAIKAGEATKAIYATDFGVETKKDESPITLADKESHRIITQALQSTGLPIMSEEGRNIPFSERKTWSDYWLIDPLDGTKEFIKKNGEFTINIALIHQTAPVLGVIYVPVLDLLYFSSRQIGAFKAGQAIQLVQKASDTNELISKSEKLPLKRTSKIFTVVASRSHLTTETEEYIDGLKKDQGEVELMSRGSSLKLCMIAEGTANVYPRFAPTIEWDTAAGQAIVECSGGKVLQINKKDPIRYNKIDILNPWFIAKR